VRNYHLIIQRLRDERGIALPMSLLALLILSTLVIAFTLLASSEPLVATNQKMVAQARSVAESGLERAIWALNNPTDPNGIPDPLVGAAPAPYDGSAGIPILVNGTQIGLAFVTVTNGVNPNERNVVTVGWVPTNTGSASKAHQKIQATVSKFLFRASPPPAALTVAGEVNAGGNVDIDSRTDLSCGPKDGSWSAGSTDTGGSATIYGADGNNVANQSLSGTGGAITDKRQGVPSSAFDPYILKNADMNTLKAYAIKNGTYYQGSSVQGLTFNAGNKLKNGIVFIDTVSGNNIDYNATTGAPCAGCTSTSDFASVAIHGGFAADSSGIFSGMIVVAGSLAIDGDVTMHGLVYTVNDLTYVGTGNGEIDGAVFSQNVRDVSSTTIDTNTGGNAQINYNCNYASNPGGQLPQGFSIAPGTYKEVSGS
jgi:Tfp pilus assembly protein PilX